MNQDILSIIFSYYVYSEEEILEIYYNLTSLNINYEYLKNNLINNIRNLSEIQPPEKRRFLAKKALNEIDNEIFQFESTIKNFKLHLESLDLVEFIQGLDKSEYTKSINTFISSLKVYLRMRPVERELMYKWAK